VSDIPVVFTTRIFAKSNFLLHKSKSSIFYLENVCNIPVEIYVGCDSNGAERSGLRGFTG
jgi:hypothetical protein